MKKNLKEIAEKSLKSFLKKKKIGYTVALLTAFLITGGIGLASSTDLSMEGARTQEGLLFNIEAQKAEIQAMLDENEARLKQLKMDNLSLINEADWYSKPWYPSYFVSLGGSFAKTDSKKNKWVNSNKDDTNNDHSRRAYGSYEKQNHKGTGWIMNNSGWNSFSSLYDNEAKLTIIPILTPPEVLTPAAPSVAFTIPNAPATIQEPTVVSPTSINLNPSVQPATVSIPTVTPPVVPSFDINVKDENVTLNVSDINVATPGTITIPTLTPPIPNLGVSPVTPAPIKEPNPTLPDPPVVIAPEWAVYNPPGDTHMGRGNFLGGWISWDKWWTPTHNLFDRTPLRSYGDPANGYSYDYVHSMAAAPLFQTISANGGNFIAVNSGISVNVNGFSHNGSTPLSGWRNADMRNLDGTVYTGYTDTVNSGDYIGGVTPTSEEVAANGRYNAFNNNLQAPQYHVAVFATANQANLKYNNITADIGGGVTLIVARYATGTVELKDSNINLYGQTSVIGRVNAYDTVGFDLTNTSFNVLGNENALFSFTSTYGGHLYSALEPRGQITLNMNNNIDVNKKKTVVLSLRSEETYRGFTVNSNGLQYYYRDGYKYDPTPGAIMFSSTGSINMYGAQNNAIRINAATLGLKNTTNPSYNPINNLIAKMSFGGDENVGIYFGKNNDAPTYNGIYRGILNLDFTFGKELSSGGGTIQNADGDLHGDLNRAERSVGIIVDSGQRKELNHTSLYPATERGTDVGGYWNGSTFNSTFNYGVTGINGGGTSIATGAQIADLKFDNTNFKAEFGKYSKDNLMLVARNGSVVEWGGTNVSDNLTDLGGV